MSKRLKKVLKITGFVVLGLVLLGIGSIHYMMSTFSSDGTYEALANNGIPYFEKKLSYGPDSVQTVCIGDTSKPKALLIHGSPGHWFDWEFILTNETLLAEYCLIAYDRPGYGGTSIPAQSSLSAQADVAAAVMKYYCAKTRDCYVVVGHSYGGGVVEQILLDFPDLVDKGIYVAGTLSPDHQRRKWYNYAASLWVVKWLLPAEMRSSNVEMMRLAQSLEENAGRHDAIHQPLVLIQGTEDVLVPYETVEYYKSQKSDGVKYMIIEGMNHFVPWSDPELIVEAMSK